MRYMTTSSCPIGDMLGNWWMCLAITRGANVFSSKISWSSRSRTIERTAMYASAPCDPSTVFTGTNDSVFDRNLSPCCCSGRVVLVVRWTRRRIRTYRTGRCSFRAHPVTPTCECNCCLQYVGMVGGQGLLWPLYRARPCQTTPDRYLIVCRRAVLLQPAVVREGTLRPCC